MSQQVSIEEVRQEMRQVVLAALSNLADVCKARGSMLLKSEDPYDKTVREMYFSEEQQLLKARSWILQLMDQNEARKMTQAQNPPVQKNPRETALEIKMRLEQFASMMQSPVWPPGLRPVAGNAHAAELMLSLWSTMFHAETR